MSRKSVLYLDKVLLARRRGPIRGVEIFNLNLIRDLAGLGIEVTVACHASWRPTVVEACGDQVEAVGVVAGHPLAAGVETVIRLGRRRFDVLLLANVANGLIPAIRLLQWRETAGRTVLIAHRETSVRFLRALDAPRTVVVAANGKIAEPFRKAGGFAGVDVFYGITEADRFHPPATRGRPGIVRFGVLGQLDNAWKGADLATTAFRQLPAELKGRVELNLASFTTPPAYPGEPIRTYGWMPFLEVPEFLRSLDILIVPSRDEGVMRETFSQAMVQGMLTGLPILASDLPVLAEKLDCGGGLLFKDLDSLREAMIRVAASDSLREVMGREARQTALARYVWNSARFAERFLFPVAKDGA